MGGIATKYCFTCCLGQYSQYTVFDQGQVDDSPSSFPCAATGLYLLVPGVNNDEQLRGDAERLYRSMKGLGTRDSDLIRVLSSRTPEEIQRIKAIFDTEFGEGDNLEQWIRDDTSGDWERSLAFALKDLTERDADLIHDALLSMNMDKELRELMCSRSNAQMMRIQAAHTRKYGKAIVGEVKDDAHPNMKRLISAIQGRAEFLATQLHDALKDPKNYDDMRIIRILSCAPRSNQLMRKLVSEYEDSWNQGWSREIEYELSMPDLQDIKDAYTKLFQKNLVQDIANATTGNYRRTLLTLVQPPEETDADALNLALEGKTTDDALLTEIMTCRSNRSLQEASQIYQKKYGRPLRDAISSDTNGDYQKMLLALLQVRAELEAENVRDATSGMGADDTRLMSLIFGKTRSEIRRLADAFQKLYGKPLEEAIRKERRQWYKRFLIYIVRQSQERYAWVPEQQIRRLRDV